MWVAFAYAKATHIFSTKILAYKLNLSGSNIFGTLETWVVQATEG